MNALRHSHSAEEIEVRSQELRAQRLRARQLFLCYTKFGGEDEPDLTELDEAYWAYYDEEGSQLA